MRTSRNPSSSRALAARATSGVIWRAWFAWVCRARLTPRDLAFAASRPSPSWTSSRRKCCGSAARLLEARRMSRTCGTSSTSETNSSSRTIGTFAMSPPDTSTSRISGRRADVVEHRRAPLALANCESILHDLLRALSDEIHPRAVPAVLRARGHELDEHLRGIAVRQALDGPHVPLVQAVATGPRMARKLRVALRVGREHVAPDGVFPEALLVHRVQHLRRNEQRHRRVFLLIALDAGCKRLGEVRTKDLRELPHVLHGVRQLPGARLPFRLRDVPESREPPPVGLDEVALRPG